MDSLELLEKRKHVHAYDMDRHPPKEDVEKVLWKAWKVTQSKQKMMAYSVFVLGPDKEHEKFLVYKNVVKNHADAEYRAAKMGKKDTSDYIEDKEEFYKIYFDRPNRDYFHIKQNPYLIIFTSRVVTKTNAYNERQRKKTPRSSGSFTGRSFYDQMHESHVHRIKDSVSVEVGMFAQNLTTFCMEEEIDISFCSCFVRDVKQWCDLPFIKYEPRLLVSLGYGDKYRRRNEDDLKPEPEEIIEWI